MFVNKHETIVEGRKHMHVRIHVHIQPNIHTHLHLDTHIHLHTHLQMHVHTYTNTRACTYTRACTCAFAYACTCGREGREWRGVVVGGSVGGRVQKRACILEADESTRMRMGETLPKYQEDHIAGKGDNSLQQYNLVHKFIPVHQAMKIPAGKGSSGSRMGETWKRFWRGTWRKSEVNQRWSMKQGRTAPKFILPHWWTSVIWRMLNWRQRTKSIKVELFSAVIL